jgi:hypothetical protein
MDEVETKQYCVTVKVWVWAEDAKRAEKVAVNSMNYLCGSDAPIAGFDVVEVNEDREV